MRTLLWAECANTSVKLDNAISKKMQPSCYFRFHGKHSPILHHLRTFGEVGVVKTASPIQAKLENKGNLCIFLGYQDQGPADSYRFLRLATNKIITSRDVTWLNMSYGNFYRVPIKDRLILQEDQEYDSDPEELQVSGQHKSFESVLCDLSTSNILDSRTRSSISLALVSVIEKIMTLLLFSKPGIIQMIITKKNGV